MYGLLLIYFIEARHQPGISIDLRYGAILDRSNYRFELHCMNRVIPIRSFCILRRCQPVTFSDSTCVADSAYRRGPEDYSLLLVPEFCLLYEMQRFQASICQTHWFCSIHPSRLDWFQFMASDQRPCLCCARSSVIGNFGFEGTVVSVLDRVVCSTRQELGNRTPLVSKSGMRFPYRSILFFRPGLSNKIGAQLIDPPLPNLLASAPGYSFGNSRPRTRTHLSNLGT